MIASFADKDTERLFNGFAASRLRGIERAARKKLLILHAATYINELKAPPGNHLELLLGRRQGQYSIRINAQWRLCFRWQSGTAYDVEIVDYH